MDDYRVGDDVLICGHKMRIIKIFLGTAFIGKRFLLDCEKAGCCDFSSKLKIECNSKDLEKLKGYFSLFPLKQPIYKLKKDQDFQVGDEVFDIEYGEGVVDCVDVSRRESILVKFEKNKRFVYYLPDGKKRKEDYLPTLFHRGTSINIKLSEPIRSKEKPWVNIYVVDGCAKTSAIEYRTKETAIENISKSPNFTYIDTIQLKPKSVTKLTERSKSFDEIDKETDYQYWESYFDDLE